MRALHSTLHFDRIYDATPARLFEAFESVEARSRWGVPGDQRLTYEAADFRVGGVDVCRCGDPGALDHRVETRYLDIVPGVRIVSSEIADHLDRRLGCSLNTALISPVPGGARLQLTIQIAAIDPEVTQGYEHGWTACLDLLADELRYSKEHP